MYCLLQLLNLVLSTNQKHRLLKEHSETIPFHNCVLWPNFIPTARPIEKAIPRSQSLAVRKRPVMEIKNNETSRRLERRHQSKPCFGNEAKGYMQHTDSSLRLERSMRSKNFLSKTTNTHDLIPYTAPKHKGLELVAVPPKV